MPPPPARPPVVSARRAGGTGPLPPPPGRPLPLSLRRRVLEALGRLLASGRSLDDALRDLESAAGDPRLARALADVRAGLGEGLHLREAAARAPLVFEAAHLGLLEVGERTGGLPAVLGRLAAALARRHEALRGLRRAVAYPLGLLALSALALPLPCLLSDCGLPGYLARAAGNLALLGAVVALLALLPRILSALGLAPAARRLGARLPGASWLRGPRVRADVLQGLSMALAAGLGLPESLELAGVAPGDAGAAEACRQARARVDAGSGLASSLDAAGLLDPDGRVAVTGAEGSGDLPEVLGGLAADALALHVGRVDLVLRVAGRLLLLAVGLGLAIRLLSSPASVPGVPDEVLRQLDREIPGLFRPLR